MLSRILYLQYETRAEFPASPLAQGRGHLPPSAVSPFVHPFPYQRFHACRQTLRPRWTPWGSSRTSAPSLWLFRPGCGAPQGIDISDHGRDHLPAKPYGLPQRLESTTLWIEVNSLQQNPGHPLGHQMEPALVDIIFRCCNRDCRDAHGFGHRDQIICHVGRDLLFPASNVQDHARFHLHASFARGLPRAKKKP